MSLDFPQQAAARDRAQGYLLMSIINILQKTNPSIDVASLMREMAIHAVNDTNIEAPPEAVREMKASMTEYIERTIAASLPHRRG